MRHFPTKRQQNKKSDDNEIKRSWSSSGKRINHTEHCCLQKNTDTLGMPMLVTLSRHVVLTKIKIMETAVNQQMSYNAVGPITYKSSTYCTASNDSTDSKNT